MCIRRVLTNAEGEERVESLPAELESDVKYMLGNESNGFKLPREHRASARHVKEDGREQEGAERRSGGVAVEVAHTPHQKTPRCGRLHGETETHSKPHDGWSVKMGFGIHTVEKSAFFGHLPCVCVCVRIG